MKFHRNFLKLEGKGSVDLMDGNLVTIGPFYLANFVELLIDQALLVVVLYL